MLAAVLLVERIAHGEVREGARDAGEELSLANFEPLFAGLSVEYASAEHTQIPALYARVMGADFDRLAPALKSIHSSSCATAGQPGVPWSTRALIRLPD